MRPARISVHGATKCQRLPAYLRSKDSNRTVTNYLIPVSAVWKRTDGGVQQLLSKSRIWLVLPFYHYTWFCFFEALCDFIIVSAANSS